MADIKYILELPKKISYDPRLAIGAYVSNDHAGQNICMIETGSYTDTYWTDWGGTYDAPDSSHLELYFSGFLTYTESIADFLDTDDSFYVSGSKAYLNLSRYAWQYGSLVSNAFEVTGYQSATSDDSNPSEIRYDYNGVLVKYWPILNVPTSSLKNALSDIITGTVLYSTWSVTLDNSDGRFDGDEENAYFNAPARLKKTTVSNPTLSDYKTVRYGLVDNIDSTFDDFTVDVSDINRTMDDDVCSVFDEDTYPDADDSVIDENIPIAYGTIVGASLIEVYNSDDDDDNDDDEYQYVVADSDYIEEITSVYDSDGDDVDYTYSGGIITTEEEASTCSFMARENSIGAIITSEISAKSNISYQEGPWDTTETDWYIANSAFPDIFFDSGDVKDLVIACLEGDNAFLINKNDGRLTLRQWGQTYDEHTIPSWSLTKTPKKTHVESKYYMSSCKMYYLYTEEEGDYTGSYLDDSQENDIIDTWSKYQRLEFETPLRYETDVIDLTDRLLARFKDRREVWTIYTSEDTSEINPLDTVYLDITINGRTLSTITTWTVRSVNPAQDVLVLEEAT